MRAVDDASDAEVDTLIETYLDEYDVAPELRPGGDRADALRDGARIELGLRGSSTTAGSSPSPTTFEDLHGLTQLPGPGRPAPDARRLRLRRRGRLEDGRHGPGDEGHGRRACPAGCRSWRTTPTTSTTDGDDLVLGAHMLEVCESIAGDAAAPGGPPAVDRRQGRSGPARLRRPSRSGGHRLAHRPGRPVPDGRRPSSTSSTRPSRCRACRSPGRSGNRGPTCVATPRPGSSPAAPTTRRWPTRSTGSIWPTWPRCAASSGSASTRRPSSRPRRATPLERRRVPHRRRPLGPAPPCSASRSPCSSLDSSAAHDLVVADEPPPVAGAGRGPRPGRCGRAVRLGHALVGDGGIGDTRLPRRLVLGHEIVGTIQDEAGRVECGSPSTHRSRAGVPDLPDRVARTCARRRASPATPRPMAGCASG